MLITFYDICTTVDSIKWVVAVHYVVWQSESGPECKDKKASRCYFYNIYLIFFFTGAVRKISLTDVIICVRNVPRPSCKFVFRHSFPS